jgi:cytochrome c-type biogenesis protein CcmE
MTRKGRRLTLIVAALAIVGLAVGLILYALKDNIVFFYSPAEVAQKSVAPGTRLRIGGLVKPGSVQRLGGLLVHFTVTDNVNDIAVLYEGQLPDLFKQGQGVVVSGVLRSPEVFVADPGDGVLAKHDEKYMPRDVAEALKKQGRWQESGPVAQGAPKP